MLITQVREQFATYFNTGKYKRKNLYLLGSGVPGRVLLVLSCWGREGADNLPQLALQADTPVGDLHQAIYFRTERLPTGIGE